MPSLPPLPGPWAVGFVDVRLPATDATPNGTCFRLWFPTTSTKLPFFAPRWIPHRAYVTGTLRYMTHNALPSSSYLRAAVTHACLALFHVFSTLVSLTLRLASAPDAPLLPPSKQQLFPASVLSHGLGGMRNSYHIIACHLASAGRVVATVEHADGTAAAFPLLRDGSRRAGWMLYDGAGEPRGKALHNLDVFPLRSAKVALRVAEIKAVGDALASAAAGVAVVPALAPFASRIDVARLSLVGHSFGGASVVAAAAVDRRFASVVAYDPWMAAHGEGDASHSTWPHPARLLVLLSEPWTSPIGPVFMSRLRLAVKGCSDSGGSATVFGLKGTTHLSFGDVLAMLPPRVARAALSEGGCASVGEVLRRVAAATTAFLDEAEHPEAPLGDLLLPVPAATKAP